LSVTGLLAASWSTAWIMVNDSSSFSSCPSNPQASPIPSAAMELTLVKVSSMANVRKSSAAMFSCFLWEIKEERLSKRERRKSCEIEMKWSAFWNGEMHSTWKQRVPPSPYIFLTRTMNLRKKCQYVDFGCV